MSLLTLNPAVFNRHARRSTAWLDLSGVGTVPWI
jgi:hypothetical protein